MGFSDQKSSAEIPYLLRYLHCQEQKMVTEGPVLSYHVYVQHIWVRILGNSSYNLKKFKEANSMSLASTINCKQQTNEQHIHNLSGMRLILYDMPSVGGLSVGRY